MRTTLTIDDELYRRTKERAAATGRSVGSVVEEALRIALALPDRVQPPRAPMPASPGGLLPGVDLDDTAGLLDVMDRT